MGEASAAEDAPGALVAVSSEPSSSSTTGVKRRRTQGDAVVPIKRQHSGMFREQTIRGVIGAAQALRSLEDSDASAILEVLDELSDYVVDERVLDKTKIGREVGALQKHSDPEVSSRARALVTQWKKDRETRLKVANSFVSKAKLDMKDARRLEEGLFNAACPLGFLDGDGFKAYHQHFMRISTHLRAQGPGSLVERLRNGELTPGEVAFCEDESLLSEAQIEKLERDRQAGLQEALASTGVAPEGTPSSEYACPRCSSSRCLYKDVQTGWHNDQQDVTILVHCLDCGERWKANDDHGLGGS